MKIGIIGAGFMARTHLAGWRAIGEEVVGVFGYQDPTTEALVRDEGLRSFADLGVMAENCDVIDICTPTYTHKEYVLAAAAAGRAIFCEKPLALSLEDGREMVEAAAEAGVPLGVGHVLRFFPEYVRAATTAKSGELGELAVLRFSRGTFAPKSGWYLDEERSGGVILDLMIHDLDFARYVAGEVTRVYAKVDRGFVPGAPGQPDRPATGAAGGAGEAGSRAEGAAGGTTPRDAGAMPGAHAHAILTHASGAITHVEGSWRLPQPEFRTSFEIAGSKALITFDSQESDALVPHIGPPVGAGGASGGAAGDGAAGAEEKPDVPVAASPVSEDPYSKELEAFRDAAARGAPLPVPGEEGLRALQLALGAIESARTGEPVEIRPLEAHR